MRFTRRPKPTVSPPLLNPRSPETRMTRFALSEHAHALAYTELYDRTRNPHMRRSIEAWMHVYESTSLGPHSPATASHDPAVITRNKRELVKLEKAIANIALTLPESQRRAHRMLRMKAERTVCNQESAMRALKFLELPANEMGRVRKDVERIMGTISIEQEGLGKPFSLKFPDESRKQLASIVGRDNVSTFLFYYTVIFHNLYVYGPRTH